MNLAKATRLVTVCLAFAGMLLPRAAWSEQQDASVVDVALRPNGSLLGRSVDASGGGVSAPISVWHQGALVAETVSAANGSFEIHGLQGGVCNISSPQGRTACRIWTNLAAPPSAVESVLLVEGPTVRGQVNPGLFGGSIINFVSNPWVVAGIAATAIATPLAVDQGDAS